MKNQFFQEANFYDKVYTILSISDEKLSSLDRGFCYRCVYKYLQNVFLHEDGIDFIPSMINEKLLRNLVVPRHFYVVIM